MVGCALVALLAVTRLEPVLTPAANGLTAPVARDGPPPGAVVETIQESSTRP